MTNLTYKDTRNYNPIDASKGIDLLTGNRVLADDIAPEGYEAMPKCKNCSMYVKEDEFNGICEASTQEPKFFAYGEMVSVTCESYKAK